MNYDPNKNYVFTDQNGNTFTSKGDNGYVWQSITEGVPISVDENGEWHVGPYLNVTPDGIVAHVPQWFKGTDEYKDWNDTWVPQLMAEGTTLTADRFRQYEKILKSLGNMGGLRYSLKNDIKSFDKNNLLSQDDVNYFTDSFVRAVAEGQGGDDAKLTIWGQDYNSAADFARHYKDLSKESLSKAMTSMYDIMNKGKEGTWDDKPEYLRDAVLASRILNYIDDNSQQYGKNNEFDGLLKSSVWQQINRGLTQFMSGVSSNSFVGIPARLAYAGLEAGFGSGEFNMRIEDLYNKRLSTGADLGANLEGNDAADVVGTWGGTIGTIAVTMATMQGFKGWLNGKMLNASSSSLWGKLGTVADTVAFDFFVNDMPIDLMMFAQDSIKYGADKAWFDPENPQPLFGLPFIRRAADNNYYLSGFGPDVPGGLLMNMVGDLIIDLTPKTISIVLNYLDNNFNMRTQATVARVREKVAVANLALQEKLANIPVFGDGWHRFINGMMGTRQSTIVTEGRKAAIAQADMDWYIRAQNVLTLNNHNGMTEVYPRYAKIDTDLKIGDSITKFQIDANKYGGMGVTRVEWPEINPKTGKIDSLFNEVPSRIPVQVHQGLLDIERLSELKGEVGNEGGVLLNPARQKEIAELEERISKLPKDIKDFADRFSEANKRVEQMRVELGISTQEWIDSLQIDPRWEKYMTRQALTVGGRYVGTGATPPDAKILNASRKGYYADNYIDPTIALGLKLEALGRAYAWNETQKFVVAAEIAQGNKVIAGKGGVEIAQRLSQVRQELTERVEIRNEIGYDKAVSSYSDDMSSVRNAFTKINDQLHLPERLSLKSVYDASQNPRIKEMVTDFNNGKITFADGVKDNLGLTDSDAASVIQNTYAYKGMEYRKTDRLSGADLDKAAETFEKTADAKVSWSQAEGGKTEFNVPDTVKDVLEGATIDYNAGMSPDGRAFKYEIEDGKITSMEEITDSEGLSAALTHVGGSFNVPQKFVETLGVPISQAVGRTIMFYRDNMPDIGLSSTFYTTYDYGNWGFVPWPNQSNGMNPFGVRVVDGKIEIDTVPVYICQPSYAKGQEESILARKKEESASGYKPKNTGTLESTPTHENGHSLIDRLGILELNRKIDEGIAPKIKSLEEAMERIPAEIEGLQEIMIKNALESLGMKYTNSNVNRMAATISEYAMKPIRQMTEPNPRIKNGHGEIFSEAMRMYQGNGQNSSPFCLAIVEQMKKFSENHSMAAAPGAVMVKNGLDIPKKMMKDEQYNFPASVKTNKQKAKWLDEWRQKNPYINGKKMFTETDYQKANLWDTFFQKEIRSYDAKSKSVMPDVLATKNGDFLKKLSADAAKNMVDEIKKASIKGFDEDLASIVLSGNSRDIFNSIQEFIVKRMNKTASEIAKKMPGGATAENMIKARATVWGDGVMKNETISMLQSLSPDAGSKSVVNFVDKLFKEQAEGFASIDALPLDTKNLIEQKEELQARLAKENRYAQKKGKEVDKASPLKGEHTQIISYKQDGEDVYVVITDPVVATLLQKPDLMKENKLSVEAMAYAANFVSRAYRVGTTSANPIAYVRNVLRDPMQATIQGNFNPLNMTLSPDIFYHTLRDYGLDDKTIKTVTDKLYTWSKSSGLTQEMRNMGIDTPGNVGYRSRTEKVAKKIRNSDNLATKIIEWGERPLEAWETMFRNQIAQQSFVKSYRRTGDVNKALGQAYFDASNSTTNFSHSIACFKRATGTVPYLSSAINGVRSFWVQFNADPIGMVTRISAGFMVPAMAITAWNLSSEERRKAYMNLPEWYRDGHLVLVDLEGNVFSLPIPEELSQFYGTARRLIEFTQEASPYSIPQILAKGAFGFLPVETDGYFGEDGSINWERGTAQMLSGLMPQAVTAIYEFAFEKDLFTGQDLSDYTIFQRWLNAGTNVLGTGFKNLVNDVGTILGAPKEFKLGKNTAETLARDLFGVGFDNVKYEFMEYIGNPTEYNYETGKTKQATGLFKENEKLQEELAAIDKDIAFADEEKKAELEELKQKKINDFTERVTSLTNKYLTLYTQVGGLEEWQKEKLVKLLTLGRSTSSAAPDSYQKADSTTAYLNERALAQQRYIDAGLPAGPSIEALADNGSIDLQAAINRFYGVTKQATQDYKNAVEDSGMKDVKDRFYDVMQKIYDSAEEQNKQPDYDLIEKIQARYLQMMDAAIIPIINQYGINILNNNDFIDAVRRQVNGMIPSDDWRQSAKNAKRFLSTKEFPTATVDVKKWLKKRYSSGMRDRGLDSDPEVAERLESIKADIDAGRAGAAAGKIDDLKKGVNKASYYISGKDLQTLNELYNMVK